MKGDKLMTIAAAICVAAAVVLPSPAGTRPYEFDWANRTADDRPVLLPLVSADGWTCEATGATAVFTTACERFLAATVAFGHQGFFMKGNSEDEDQSYFMLLGTGRHYCKSDAKEIRYADADGNLLDTSAAVASGIYRRSQVAVRYADGTQTAANGSTDCPMLFKRNGRWLVLPPNGFFANAGDGSACVVSGATWKGGGRLDLSVAPDYAYLNAYDTRAVTPFGGTNGRMYRLLNSDGTDEVFLCKGSFFMLPYVAASVTALDEAGKGIGPAPFTVETGRTLLARMKGAFSYRVAKPASWREPNAACVIEGYLKEE